MKLGTKLSVLVVALGLGALSTGCVAGGGDLPSVEGAPSVEAETWSEWGEVAPGVRQRSSSQGTLETEVRGVDGFNWQIARFEADAADLKARSNAAKPEERAALEKEMQATEERLKDAQDRRDALLVKEALGEALGQGHDVINSDDKSTMAGPCYLRTYAYYYSAGYVDAYAYASCTATPTNPYTYARACVGGTCIAQTSNPSNVTVASSYSGGLTCTSGASYNSYAYVSTAWGALTAQISGSCW